MRPEHFIIIPRPIRLLPDPMRAPKNESQNKKPKHTKPQPTVVVVVVVLLFFA